MANFNVTLNVQAGKGGSCNFSATNGDGLSSGDPLDVNAGDTVTFISGSGSTGTARFRDLSIFTSNADIDILAGGSNVVRTVASGSLLVNVITGLNGGQLADDLFYIKRLASSSQDTTPNSFTLQNVTNAQLSTIYQSVAQQVTGITGTVTVTVSGDGSPQVKIGSGSWTSGPTTITNNFYINARLTSSASNSTGRTATVTVGTYSTTFVATTVAASGGSSGGTSGGTGVYGVEVYDTDGTTTVLSPSTRYVSFMQGPQTITVPGNSTVLLQQDMTGLDEDNCDLAFTDFGSFIFTVNRVTTGPVSGQGFQLTNPGAGSFVAKPYILRF